MATVIKKKIDDKKLDEFISTSERLMIDLNENWPKYASILGIVVLLVVILVYMDSSQKTKRSSMFQKISQAEWASTEANRDSTIKELEGIVNEFGGVEGVAYAELALARQYLLAGNSEKGSQLLSKIGSNDPTSLYSQLAALELGSHLELSGKCNEALGRFKSIIDGTASFTKAEAYIGSGRCQEVAGDKTSALVSYKAFIENFPGYAGHEFAEERIKVLGG